VLGGGLLIFVLLYFLQFPKKSDSYPFPKDVFFGRRTEQEEIIRRLKKEEIFILNIYGLGGVGKTSLIREITKGNQLFTAIIWQTAKKQLFDADKGVEKLPSTSATFENLCAKIASFFGEQIEYQALTKEHQKIEFIEKLMERHKTLLVIDNFETYDEEINIFIKNLKTIVEGTPSKAVLTCRYKVEAVASYKLEGLTFEETAELLNHELALENGGISLAKEKIQQIYETTNGLPLAIKLIAARVKEIHIEVLDDILERLSNVDFNNPAKVYQQFYRFIYQEIWKDLSKDAKKLLIKAATFSIAEPISYKNLQLTFFDNREGLSSAERRKFAEAFSENIKFALLESKSVNNEHRFFIHPLTKAFVEADLLKKV
jgi:AAA+ ATPase superfamily predicted ATPase